MLPSLISLTIQVILLATILVGPSGRCLAQVPRGIEQWVLEQKWSQVRQALTASDSAADPVARFLHAYASLATDDYKGATELYSKLGNADDIAKLVDYASALAQRNPGNAIAQMLKGDALARSGKYEEALVAGDNAIRLDQRSALIYNSRGVVRALIGKREAAISDFEQAIGLDPKFADAHANLGLAQLAVGSAPAAVENLTQALELAPDFALAYNSRGVAYTLMEAWDEAESDFKKAAEFAPGVSYIHGNTQSATWTKGQIAFRQSLLNGADDGRGGTLITQSYDHRVVGLADGKTIDVFVIKATPQTSTLEGMKTVVQDITWRLRTQNDLPDTWQPRFHMDAHGWNSTPYGQMPYAAEMAQQADRDAVVAVDLSSWYKGKNKLGLIQKTLTWTWNVSEAARQTARVNAAINEVTGIKPTFTGNSGGAEVIPRMGELMARSDLPTDVVKNVRFSNLVLTAYPFHQFTGGDVEIPNVLLERIDKLSNIHTTWGQWSNTVKPNEKVVNIQITDAKGKGIWHGQFIDVTLPDGQPNPVLKIGGAALRGQEFSSPLRDEQNRRMPSLPSVRAVAKNLDRFYQAMDLLYKITNTEMPMEMKAPMAVSGSIMRDLATSRNQKSNFFTSQSLETIGRFGLKELPKLVDRLVTEGRLPSYYRDYLNSPLMKGVPDLVAGAASQVGRGQWMPSVDEVTQYLDGLNKIAWATVGGLVGGSKGASIASTAAGLTADIVRGASEPLFRQWASSPVRKTTIENWRAHVDAAIAHGVAAKTFSEMYTPQDLKQMGFDATTIAEFDDQTRWYNSSLDYRRPSGATSASLQNLQRPMPTSTTLLQDDVWKKPALPWRRRNDVPPPTRSDLFIPPSAGPPPPPSGGDPRRRQPEGAVGSATNPPNNRLPSTASPGDKRGGVKMKADVVKGAPADMSEMFGGGASGKSTVATQQEGLFSPFLLFCAIPTTGK
jgi:tetratricopeptide (TPR) repeat protein